MKKEDIAVLIPIYTTSLNPQETISLRQNIKVLKDYTIIFVKPETLDISVGGHVKYIQSGTAQDGKFR